MRRAKSVVPSRPPRFVERAALRTALDEQCEPHERGRVVLVSAPAGHGKTAAVADWVRADPATPTAWVSLDEGDREETDWWEAVLATLTTTTDVFADGPLHLPNPSWNGAHAHERGEFLAATLNALEALPQRVRLVLDDVHEIVGHPALGGLLELLRHPLPMLTVVLCSRYDPPIGIDRLRLDGRFGQIRVDQLTFSERDAAHLFAREGLDLDAEQSATLVARTQGWVAALRLAALSLHDCDDTAGFVADFAGDDRSVADYLVGEVLARLSESDHALLAAAAVSSPLHVDLAAVLTDVRDAADTLDRLEAGTAMVVATDRRREYYRLHELLRSHVLARLRRNRPEHLADLYRRTATWHDARGDSVAALRCATQSRDVETTQALVLARAVELVNRGEFSTLAQSAQLVGRADGDPRVRLALGLAALEQGDLDRGEELIDLAEAELTDNDSDHVSDNVTVFRHVVALRVAMARGRIDRVVAEACAIRPEIVDGTPLRALALATRGTGLITADSEQARRHSSQALVLADLHGWHHLAVQAQATLGLATLVGGDRAVSSTHARSAVARAADHGWAGGAGAQRARVVLAYAEIMRGRPDAGRAHVDGPAGDDAAPDPHVGAALDMLRGAADHDTGRRLAGWELMRHTRVTTGDLGLGERQLAVAGLLEQDAALGLGRTREAAEVTRALGHRLEGSVDGALLHARQQWAATGDPAARTLLTPVFERRYRLLSSLGIVEALVLDAEIAASLDDRPRVRRQLRRALRLATRFEVLRPLLRLPDEVRLHLATHRGAFGGLDVLVDEILAHPSTQPSRGTGREALTERERAVLELLPTMRSASEIAGDLAVSVNTVKTHQRAIYHKLGAASRRDAVTRARQMGLVGAPPHSRAGAGQDGGAD